MHAVENARSPAQNKASLSVGWTGAQHHPISLHTSTYRSCEQHLSSAWAMLLLTDAMSANSRDALGTFTALSYTAPLSPSVTSGRGSGRRGAGGAARRCSHNAGCETSTATHFFFIFSANQFWKGENEFKMRRHTHSSEVTSRG